MSPSLNRSRRMIWRPSGADLVQLGRLLLHFGAVVVFSWPATVIAAAVVSFPLVYITARGAFAQLEPGLADAARTLGASEWRVFRRVTLPLAAPGIFAECKFFAVPHRPTGNAAKSSS